MHRSDKIKKSNNIGPGTYDVIQSKMITLRRVSNPIFPRAEKYNKFHEIEYPDHNINI